MFCSVSFCLGCFIVVCFVSRCCVLFLFIWGVAPFFFLPSLFCCSSINSSSVMLLCFVFSCLVLSCLILFCYVFVSLVPKKQPCFFPGLFCRVCLFFPPSSDCETAQAGVTGRRPVATAPAVARLPGEGRVPRRVGLRGREFVLFCFVVLSLSFVGEIYRRNLLSDFVDGMSLRALFDGIFVCAAFLFDGIMLSSRA